MLLAYSMENDHAHLTNRTDRVADIRNYVQLQYD